MSFDFAEAAASARQETLTRLAGEGKAASAGDGKAGPPAAEGKATTPAGETKTATADDQVAASTVVAPATLLHAAPDAAPAPPAPAAPVAPDALLEALVWLTRHHGQERSAVSLLAGLPLDGPLEAPQALRALRDAGYTAAVLQRTLPDINKLLLPAVLMLRGRGACILLRRHDPLPGANGADGSAQRLYDIALPCSGGAQRSIGEAELAADYTGYVMVATPAVSGQEASAKSRGADPWRTPGSHWLWGTLRRFVPYYRSALVAALLSNLLMLATGLITSVVYDKVIPHQAFVTLWALAIGGVLAIGFDLTARQLRNHLIDLAGRKVDLIIGSLLFHHTLSLRMEHRPASAGTHSHHLAQVETVREFFASATMAALSDLPFIVLFIAMAFIVGGPLGWVLVIAVPLILGLAVGVQSSLRRSMRASMKHQADLQGLLVESVEGLEDLKAAGAEGRFLQRFEAATEAGVSAAMRARATSSWTTNMSMVSQQLITMIMLVWGVYLIHEGLITSGALIGAVMFASRAVAPLGSVVMLATRYQGARAALLALDQLMALPTDRALAGVSAPPRISGRMALLGVGFSYPPVEGRPAPAVLNGIDLRLNAGERVAILGRIGSGKSTLLRLLGGLYTPTTGHVEVDGIDLRQLDPADFRTHVGFISQEPRLFCGSLRDNVLLGRAGADMQHLAEVAHVTGLDRLVAAHPLGWELPVGEMGALLSGGQRQLVALARCLVTKPRIILMDEPTSSMDAQSEVSFLRQLDVAAGKCTLVMVTHRPAVLELAQRVIVVDGGKLLLDGPKPQVLAALSGGRAFGGTAPQKATA